jgi:hypothetical protein
VAGIEDGSRGGGGDHLPENPMLHVGQLLASGFCFLHFAVHGSTPFEVFHGLPPVLIES